MAISIDGQLNKVINSAVTVQTRKAAAAAGTDIRPWMNFSDVAQAGKFDFTALAKIFDRSDINNGYTSAKNTDETTTAKQVYLFKIQGDILAGFERDMRMRTRSRVRSLSHTSARDKANGQTAGPLTLNSIGYLTRLLKEQSVVAP